MGDAREYVVSPQAFVVTRNRMRIRPSGKRKILIGTKSVKSHNLPHISSLFFIAVIKSDCAAINLRLPENLGCPVLQRRH